MQAVQYDNVGPASVLKVKTVPRPIRGSSQALVQVCATSVNPIDFKLRSGQVLRWFVPRPKIPGADVSGVVEDVDPGSKFKKGERVFAFSQTTFSKAGTCAEYIAVPENLLVSIPSQTSFEEAAGVPLAGLTAWQALDAAQVKAGSNVLVHAGAGGVGHYAVQLAKARGARVTTTCGPRNIDFVTKVMALWVGSRLCTEVAETGKPAFSALHEKDVLQELGADRAVDYTAGPFDQQLKGERFDAVIDVMGGEVERRSFNVLKPTGTFQSIANSGTSITRVITGKLFGLVGLAPKYGFTVLSGTKAGQQLKAIAELMEAGSVKTTIDSIHPLQDTAKAHELLETGHARGKVIIQVAQ